MIADIAPTQTAVALEGLNLQVPSLPQTLIRALQLTQQSGNVAIDDVVQLVESDPSAVARILRIANSAYFGFQGEVRDVRRAVVLIGGESILGIVMGMGMVDMRSSLGLKTSFPYLNLVRHSVAAGFIAQYLREKDPALRLDTEERTRALSEAFTAGILHDFGKIVLLHNYPEEATSFFGIPRNRDAAEDEIFAAEREAFGLDHVQTGEFWMDQLGLSTAFIESVCQHHRLGARGDVSRLMAATHAGSIVANTFGFAFNHPMSIDACLDDPVWASFNEIGGTSVEDRESFLAALQELGEQAKAFVGSMM